MTTFLNQFAESEEGKALSLSRYYDQQRWGGEYVSVEQNIEDALKWFTDRREWISSEIERKQTNVSNVRDKSGGQVIYSIDGYQVVSSTSKNCRIVINNGKKVVSH